MAEAYCVKDKQKVEIVNPQNITMKNGKPAISGTCPICGGKVFRIGGGRHLLWLLSRTKGSGARSDRGAAV